AETAVNKTVKVTVLRAGKLKTLQVKIAELKEDDEALAMNDLNDEDAETAVAGMTLTPLTDDEREALGLSDDVEGVVITSVERGSRADMSRVRAGDVIIELDKKPVQTVAAVKKAIEDKEGKSLLMLLVRGGDKLFVAFKKEQEAE
ncbi:MAG: PDZ domain-containing protein, partial [Pseudomonadota bacterium]|nr:PDZ domain-containing protein [Pseudomonadota bacterium]